MTKSEARTVVSGIITEYEAKLQKGRIWPLDEFVKEVCFPFFRQMEGIDEGE